jgi:hypothetical protein
MRGSIGKIKVFFIRHLQIIPADAGTDIEYGCRNLKGKTIEKTNPISNHPHDYHEYNTIDGHGYNSWRKHMVLLVGDGTEGFP